jgi:ankyrin repeat protein
MDETFSLDILYTNDDVPEELYTLVRNGLYSQLDTRLQELPNSIEYLTSLTCHGQGQLSLLMVAALNGYDEIIHLLLRHCDPIHQVELKGNIIISDEISIQGATALYCACYRENFTVAKTLIEFGKANINQNTYDYPHYPLLIHATIMNRLDIVRFLVENRYSDVNETKSDDCDQSTALIWAATKGYISLVEYLIINGADVNYSCTNTKLTARTPLLCAILAGPVESVQLLYDAGAEITINNCKEDSPLIIAVEKKYYSIINFLLERSINTSEDLEVVACSLISISSPMEKMQEVLQLLKLALRQRELKQIPKVCIKPMAVYDYKQECQTLDELDSIRDDRDRIFIETLLIRQRMHSSRPDIKIIEQLEEYGDSLASNRQFDKCLNVYFHIFYYYQQMDADTNSYGFVWLFCKMLTANEIIPVDRFIQVCYLTFDSSQSKQMEFCTNNALFLLIIATKVIIFPYCILSYLTFI